MDIKMPGKDGITATREIRSIRPDLPIIAQTAYGQKDEINAILEAGSNDYLFKPIVKDKFFEMLAKYL